MGLLICTSKVHPSPAANPLGCTGEPEEEGYEDQYQLEDSDVTAADYVVAEAVSNWRCVSAAVQQHAAGQQACAVQFAGACMLAPAVHVCAEALHGILPQLSLVHASGAGKGASGHLL